MAEPYTSWPIRLQLITLFIVASLLIVGFLIVLTIILIQVLQISTIGIIGQMQNDYKQQEIKMLLQQHSDQQYYFYSSIIGKTRQICALFQKIYQTQLLQQQNPIWLDELDTSQLIQDQGRLVSYDFGGFFSDYRDTHTTQVQEKINATTQMNKFSQNLYGGETFWNIYNGLTDGNLFYQYPAAYFESQQIYSIYIRDWYNSPITNPDLVYLTEPYLSEVSGTYQIGGSKSIEADGEIIGVAGIDLLLVWLSKTFQDRNIGGKGFELLVSQNGIVLSHPTDWNPSGNITLLFEEEITGISKEIWEKVQQEEYDGDNIEYQYIDGDDYYMLKEIINLPDENRVYILVNVNKDYYSEEKEKVEESFSDLYNEIFFIVVFVAAAVYLLVIILIILTTQILVKHLKVFNSLLNEILMDSHKKCICESVQEKLNQGNMKNNWISSVYDALQFKISKIEQKERQFEHYDWGNYKPKNILLFDNWKYLNRPFNGIYDNGMKWSKELKEKIKKTSYPGN